MSIITRRNPPPVSYLFSVFRESPLRGLLVNEVNERLARSPSRAVRQQVNPVGGNPQPCPATRELNATCYFLSVARLGWHYCRWRARESSKEVKDATNLGRETSNGTHGTKSHVRRTLMLWFYRKAAGHTTFNEVTRTFSMESKMARIPKER